MNVICDKKKVAMFLCNVPVGSIFKFKKDPMILVRLGGGCGYAELGGAFNSVEELDRELINNNKERVQVFGKIKSITIE